jgi:hypothetical protein
MAMLGEERFRRVLVIGSHWSFSDYSEDLDYSEDSDYSVNMIFPQRYKKMRAQQKNIDFFSDAAMK